MSGSEPEVHAAQTIEAYRKLVAAVEGVLEDVDHAQRWERARLQLYRDQFLDQLEHWRGVEQGVRANRLGSD